MTDNYDGPVMAALILQLRDQLREEREECRELRKDLAHAQSEALVNRLEADTLKAEIAACNAGQNACSPKPGITETAKQCWTCYGYGTTVDGGICPRCRPMVSIADVSPGDGSTKCGKCGRLRAGWVDDCYWCTHTAKCSSRDPSCFEQAACDCALGHADHGRGSTEYGPDDADCPCRATRSQALCASFGCGFCLLRRKRGKEDESCGR